MGDMQSNQTDPLLATHQMSSSPLRVADGGQMPRWAAEEDDTLVDAVARYGKRWRFVAQCLPNRTVAMCRHRYKRMQDRFKGNGSRCTLCGELARGHTCRARDNLDIVQRKLKRGREDVNPEIVTECPEVERWVTECPEELEAHLLQWDWSKLEDAVAAAFDCKMDCSGLDS